MLETKGIRINVPFKKGQKEVSQLYVIKGPISGEPIASLAEAVYTPLFAFVYCTFRETNPTRLFLKVTCTEPASQDGTYGVNVMLAGATDFSPV